MGGVAFDGAEEARAAAPGFGPRVAVEVERGVAAPMPRVWEVLRDYRGARPRMLTAHFADYVILEGGHGAGTAIGYRLGVGRVQRAYTLAVKEPSPRRQLRERAHGSALAMTWTLSPGGDAERTVVRLAIELRDSAMTGWLARARTQRALRRLARQLLGQLDAYLAADARASH